MTLESWIDDKASRLNDAVQSTASVTIPHALSVRIPRDGTFTRVWLPPLINSLREQFVFCSEDVAGHIPAGYLVGGKCGWRKRHGLWRMRFFGALFDFILENGLVKVVSPHSGRVATIRIHGRLMRSDVLEMSGSGLGTLRVNIPSLSFHPLTYMVLSDENGLSFRVLLHWDVGGYTALGDKGIVGKTPSFWPNPFREQPSDELTALLFHPEDFEVVSRVCERWTPALLTCLCIWVKCFETPRNPCP